jgi:hypothetical protein
MLHVFGQTRADLELRELFNVAWLPAAVAEGKPASPDLQSLPSGVFGNIFDVLVDRPSKAKAIFDYPIVWAAGDVDLSGKWPELLEDYVRKGGTLVVNAEAARPLPAKVLGLKLTGKTGVAEEWRPEGGDKRDAVPFEIAEAELQGAKVLAWAAKAPLITRHAVGDGAVIVTLAPRMLGQDERAHPALPYLFNGLTDGLTPIEVLNKDGKPLQGEIMWQLNRTRDGWLVTLVNNHGVDKTQNGVARVDRRAFADVVVRTKLPLKTAKEMTVPRELKLETRKEWKEVALRIHPGDVQAVALRE